MSSLRNRIRSLINRRSHQDKNTPQTATATGEASSKPETTPAQPQQKQAQQPIQQSQPQQPTQQSQTQEQPKQSQPEEQSQPIQTEEQPQRNQLQQQPHRVYDRAAVVATAQAATVTGTLQIALHNQSGSNEVYAYITGQAIDNGNRVFLLQSDARTPYYPGSPAQTGAAIGANVGIHLGAPGNIVTATIPRLAGARIWFSIGKPLTFLLNPGPGLVEPSVLNPADPNYHTNFSFCEFTFNSAQVFVNLSYVDFVSDAPIALTLQDTAGRSQHVGGMRANGLETVCQGLRAQTAKDGRRWGGLIVESGGKNLRALSPNSAITGHPDWFQTYWTEYVNEVWNKYKTQPLTVDTQASWGAVQGRINSAGLLDFGDGSVFGKPSADDIFSNSTGPFATGGNAKTNAIIPRLAAAFNRSVLLAPHETPNGVPVSQFYTNHTTNHYARITHSANVDGLGYAFPYDDVTANGGHPQEGAIFSFSPTKLTVAIGGHNAHA